MKTYFINYFYWWYFVQGKIVYRDLISKWRYVLEAMNLVPMITNIFKPLFQDYTWEGKLVAVPFRFIWIFFGSIFQLVYTAFLLLFFIGYLVVPFVPVIIIAFNIINKFLVV